MICLKLLKTHRSELTAAVFSSAGNPIVLYSFEQSSLLYKLDSIPTVEVVEVLILSWPYTSVMLLPTYNGLHLWVQIQTQESMTFKYQYLSCRWKFLKLLSGFASFEPRLFSSSFYEVSIRYQINQKSWQENNFLMLARLYGFLRLKSLSLSPLSWNL